MKKIALIAGVLAIAGCQAEPVEEPVAEEPEVVAADVPDGGPVVGSYTVTNPDGTVMTWTNVDDSTYSAVMADGSETAGTFVMTGREYCYDPAATEAGDEAEICLSFGDAAEDGSWISTRPDGTQATVVRIAEAAPEEGME
ncbi:MAG TPA: hypothetical protein VLA37_04280 [Sphingomonadaceae bacterium]|nr:hypothetical protein [Sphingomonadaceae bacterium]